MARAYTASAPTMPSQQGGVMVQMQLQKGPIAQTFGVVGPQNVSLQPNSGFIRQQQTAQQQVFYAQQPMNQQGFVQQPVLQQGFVQQPIQQQSTYTQGFSNGNNPVILQAQASNQATQGGLNPNVVVQATPLAPNTNRRAL